LSSKRKILIQLDTDPLPSSFDAVVAADSGAELLFAYGGVTPERARDLIYGAIFTRGPEDLRSTAVFIGGSDVAQGERVLEAARKAFLGPLRVSLLLDSGGANTTAAAAVSAAMRHLELAGRRAVVLGATGPVGRRVVRLLARAGALVTAGSRSRERAEGVAAEVAKAVPGVRVGAAAAEGGAALEAALRGAEVVVAAGGLGARLLPEEARLACPTLRVAIDLNAVPPEGIEGVKPNDAAAERDGALVYGAIGVGGIKMKIHKACVASLFEANDRVLDAEQVFDLARALEAGRKP
jgi:hypothetical protein